MICTKYQNVIECKLTILLPQHESYQSEKGKKM